MARRPRDDDDFDDEPRRAPRRKPRDDDDDFEEAPPARPKPAGGNTAVKVLAIVGVVLLGIALICGGVTIYVFRSFARGVEEAQQQMLKQNAAAKQANDETRLEAAKRAEAEAAKVQAKQRKDDEVAADKLQAATAVREFFEDLKRGQVSEAYRRTTPAYRSRMPEAAFAELLIPGGKPQLYSPAMLRPDYLAPASLREYTFEFRQPTRAATMTLTVAKQGSEWLIDHVTIPAK